LEVFKTLPPRTWTVIIGAAAAVIAVLMIGSVTTRVKSVSTRLESAQAQLDSLRPVVTEVNDLRYLKDVLDEKMDVVDRLIIGRVCWARELNQLDDVLSKDKAIPQRIWLTSIKLADRRSVETRVVEKKLGGGKVKKETERVPVIIKALEIEGQVEAEKAFGVISDLMELIRENEHFSDVFRKVELDHIGQTRMRGGRETATGKAFKLSLLMKRSGDNGG